MGPYEVTLKNLVGTYRPPMNKFKQFTRVLQVSKRVKGFPCSISETFQTLGCNKNAEPLVKEVFRTKKVVIVFGYMQISQFLGSI